MNVMPKASLVDVDDVARISHACCERISLEHGTEGRDHSVGNLCMLYKVYENGGREDTDVLGYWNREETHSAHLIVNHKRGKG